MSQRPTDQDPDRFRDPEAWPYTFELLHVDWLFVDKRYQRPKTKIAGEIAEGFDRALLEPLLVSERDENRYAIADGQNRWEGARRIGERWLWCRVMRMSPQEEARVFSDLQAKRKNISPLERFKADVFAGDEEAVGVARLLKRHGVHTSDTSGAFAEEDSLSAITAVRNGWSRHGDEVMDFVFETIRAAYPGTRHRYSGELINALLMFLMRTQDPKPDQRRLLVALEHVGTLSELMARSAAKRRSTGQGMGGGSQIYTFRVIEESYAAVGRGRFRKQWDLT